MNESHVSRQGPGTVDVIAAEADSGWLGKNITGCWSHFTGHVSPHAPTSLVYFPCAIRGWKKWSQDAAVPGGTHHTDRRRHVACHRPSQLRNCISCCCLAGGCLSRTCSYVLIGNGQWDVRFTECMLLSDYYTGGFFVNRAQKYCRELRTL